ncbi:hypothetical protein B0H14DRAFT_2609146 [Mycena olivaceomarginata]|nr:hypothetical protein B0H14DRAFT_2609146 [Mycena olivaceomarginata]
MPAGRPPLDPDIREARRQESRRRYKAKRRTEIAQMTVKDRRRHHERIAEDSARYRDRRARWRNLTLCREAELRAQEHQETVRHKKKVLATNAVHRAHGLPNIPAAQGRPPRQDLSSQRRAALPAAGSCSDDGALSDETTSGRCRTRAATPPIYEGGITPRTRTVAPRCAPNASARVAPGACACARFPQNGLSMATARDISSPPALSAVGRTVLDALASAPKARS